MDLFRDYSTHRLQLGTGQTLNIAMAALGPLLLWRSRLRRSGRPGVPGDPLTWMPWKPIHTVLPTTRMQCTSPRSTTRSLLPNPELSMALPVIVPRAFPLASRCAATVMPNEKPGNGATTPLPVRLCTDGGASACAVGLSRAAAG